MTDYPQSISERTNTFYFGLDKNSDRITLCVMMMSSGRQIMKILSI